MNNAVIKLAWRNLFRQKRRTTLLVVVVAFATAGTVFFWGFVDGFVQTALMGNARFVTAPVLVMTPEQRVDPDPENALVSLDIVTELERLPGVGAAVPRLEFAGLGRTPYTSEPLHVRGIDPEREPLVSDIPNHVIEGRMLTAPGEMVLGRRLAEHIDLRVGERLALDTSGAAGPQAAGLVLVGVLETGMTFVDEGIVLIHLDQARDLTGVATATGVALAVARGQEENVARTVNAMLPHDLQAYSVRDLLGPVREHFDALTNRMVLLSALFAIFAAMAVTSTLVVSVIERTREFGVIGALGLAPGRLSTMVVTESVLATALGWCVGIVAGYLILGWMSAFNVLGPILGTAVDDAFATLGFSNELYTVVAPQYIAYAAGTIAVAALFAVLVPARRVRRLEPAQAMRVD